MSLGEIGWDRGCDERFPYSGSYFPPTTRELIVKQHALLDILFITVTATATLAGAEGPSDVADFAQEKLTWCRRWRMVYGRNEFTVGSE